MGMRPLTSVGQGSKTRNIKKRLSQKAWKSAIGVHHFPHELHTLILILVDSSGPLLNPHGWRYGKRVAASGVSWRVLTVVDMGNVWLPVLGL
ncbi:hypothetical protein KIPB_003609 [Kipferlia bialata]|uniref:Uncharacterized protein n=1 Tax=Kipferlia bialata TaxID=797122 RepID=A0A9K3CUQ2_9EUKA|nr:hypothetical protein KIPB_003609 [Kipferlia bialata]|eukprot:g3609.t1